MANPYRQAITNEERRKGKKPSKFGKTPNTTTLSAQSNLNLAAQARADLDQRQRAARAGAQQRNDAAARQRAQAATRNAPADVQGLKARAVPGVTPAIKTQPTPSGGRVALGADAQRKVGYDADATRDIINQRKQAEISAKAAQVDAQNKARQQFIGRNPEMKNASPADVDRAMRLQGKVNAAKAAQIYTDNTETDAEKLKRREFRAQSAANKAKQAAATPQVSDANKADARAYGSQARDLDKKIADLTAAGGENPPENVKKEREKLVQQRETLRGKAAIVGTDSGDSADTTAKKAQTTPRKQVNEALEKGKQAVSDTVEKAKPVIEAGKQKVDEVVEAGKQKVEELKSSEVPGDEKPKTTGEKIKQKAGEARTAVENKVEKVKANRAEKKQQKAEKKARSRKAAGKALGAGGLVALPGAIGELGANIQEEGGVGAGLAKTGSDIAQGLESTALTAADTVEKRGLRSGVDLLQGIGEGILEAGDATGRAVAAGLAPLFSDTGDTTFSDRYRGMEGRTPLGQLAAGSAADRRARLASPGGGGVIAASPADDPAAIQPAQPVQAPQGLRGGTSGTQGTGFTGGSGGSGPTYRAEGPRGSFLEGNRLPGARGGGTFNVTQGPGGPGASVADNVAAYDRQTQSLRDLRNFARQSQGYKPVGQRTFEGYAETGFGARQRQKNLMRSKPDYDNNLTPRQNQARLANWAEGVRQQNIADGINPNTGLDTNAAQATAQGRNDIAQQNVQRLAAKDAFDQSMKGIELAMKDREFTRQMTKDDRDFMGKTQEFLTSDDPAMQAQGINNLVQAYGANPNGPTGMLAKQTLAQMFPEAAGDERGLMDYVQGLLMGGEYKAVAPSVDPNVGQQYINQGQTGSNLLFGSRVGTPGNNYFYRGDDPRAFDLYQGLRGQNR